MRYEVSIEEATTLTGIIIAMAGAFMWGVYTISARIAFREIDSRSGFSVMSIYTVAGLGLCMLVFGKEGNFEPMGPRQWTCLVISAVTAIALAHTMYYAAMKRIGTTIPALVILAQPFIVLAISHVVFGESLSASQLFFGIVLLAGSGLAIWAQQDLNRKSKPAARGNSVS
jgi:drug/metabolite transporter (DMT)-like permease